MKRVCVLVVLLLLAAAGSVYEGGSLWSSLAAEPSGVTPPKLRLGHTVKPTRYAVDLTIVPSETTFTGTIDISLELGEATQYIWLHGLELKIQKSDVWVDEKSVSARPLLDHPDFLGFALDRPIGPGPAKLHITYQGPLSRKDNRGIFAQKEGENWYVFTHFEPLDARRAFPCFDEPSFKVPWQFTLHVKPDHVALTNAPAVAETPEPNGMKTVRFAETQPLPSYLVALGVGPFALVDGGTAGKKGTPIRIITPKGRAGEAGYAARVTAQILERLENYMGIPYPYEKLDSIAVLQSGGAMENPGLITYAQGIILAKPENETVRMQRGYAGVAAHEMAHLWFGDLVTMAWWDDLWLNEAFATWMANKIIDQWKPEWDGKVSKILSRSGAMSGDRLITARKIRQPIESKHDIANAFDGITYGKGAAVLSMFETWTGADKFQKGIRRYLAKHAWGNATSADFLAALSAETGSPVAPAFATFLDQAGVPLVTAELRCEAGAPPRLALAQQRYLPAGSQGSAQQTWQIPICVKYGTSQPEGHDCQLMTERTTELTLRSAKTCPGWVLLNEGEVGYYLIRYKSDMLPRLLRDGGKHMTLPERVGIIGDVGALAQSGEIPLGEALALIPEWLKDPNRHIISGTIGILGAMNERIVPDELRPNYARFIREMYGAKARALGWKPKPDEDDNTRLLRTGLLGLVAGEGEDKALAAEADQLARRWLEDRRAVDADLVGSVLRVAARYGDRALFDRFHAEAKKTADRMDRNRLLGAMGAFRDPDIVRAALAIVLTEEFNPSESLNLLLSTGSNPKTRAIVYEFVKQNFDALVAKFPTDSGASLAYTGGGFCSETERADVEGFFKDRSTKYTGGPRILAQVLERIRLCSAFRAVQQPSVVAFLKRY